MERSHTPSAPSSGKFDWECRAPLSASTISLLACPLPRQQRQCDIGGGGVLLTRHARIHNPCSVPRYRRRGGQHYYSSGAWRLPRQSKTRITNRRRQTTMRYRRRRSPASQESCFVLVELSLSICSIGKRGKQDGKERDLLCFILKVAILSLKQI